MKANFTLTDSVCLTNAEFANANCRQHLWRQVRFLCTAAGVRFTLMSVDREAAAGGYWSGGSDVRDYTISWDELDNHERFNELMHHEQVCVASTFGRLLEHVTRNRDALQAVLKGA